MTELFLGLVLGAVLTFGIYALFTRKRRQEQTVRQSSILLEKIRTVCKLITVEGDFAEVFRYENRKDYFGNLFSSRKKALVIVNARAQVGYDFKKLELTADTGSRTIAIRNFPQPEILSIEPELEFYDIRNDIFSPFTPDDLTALSRDAKSHIRNKIPESGLMDAARTEALEVIRVMEKIAETIGWTLDYRALETGTGHRKEIQQPDPIQSET